MVRHTPLSEQKRLVARWRQSGLSRTAFSASVGIPNSTFTAWAKKHTEDTALVTTQPEFIDVTPVVTPMVTAPAPITMKLALQGRNPLELTFDTLPEPQWFGAMLREASAC